MKKTFSIILAVVAAVVAFAIGILIGAFAIDTSTQSGVKEDISVDLQNEIKAENIDTNLRYLSSVPHLAGTEEDLKQAEWVRDRFLHGGLDEAQVVPYQVLLSYPDFQKPNIVYLLNGSGQVQFQTKGYQSPLKEPEENHPSVAPNFNAYSGTGIAQGQLVYVYYGREEDFDLVKSKSVDVQGKIVLARYGALFRANIVLNAEQRGAAGVLLFSDPQDFARDGRDSAYPDSWWLPGMGVQSGTVYVENGDPLTPFYPAIESAYRIPEDKAKLPRIPVQPIGYDEAEVFLRSLEGTAGSPDQWRGALNASYSLGPSPSDLTVKMDVKTRNTNATTYNTIGFLYGEEEPDRYVLMGNHRDAWILGSVDPSSGTASMVELARAFGTLKNNKNWRPRRTLVFCSWGAEEYGLIGSYEWVEEHAKVLAQRAVAYLNVDIAVEGNYALDGSAVPLLQSALIDAAMKTPNPNPQEVAAGRSTVFDTWIKAFPNPNDPTIPNVRGMGSGSDYTAFIHMVGIPCMDIRYSYEENVNSYPLYHTLYETHYLSEMIDPDFKYHQATTRMWGQMALTLAEALLVPFNVTNYANYLEDSFRILKGRYEAKLLANNATFSHFETSVAKFKSTAKDFTDKISTLENEITSNSLEIRKINDQLIQVERSFIDPRGLPDRPEYNHIVLAPSSSNGYASDSFAGFADLMEAVGDQSEVEDPETWAKIKQHLAVIAFYIDAAATSLKDGL